jgi:hypothetical protein
MGVRGIVCLLFGIGFAALADPFPMRSLAQPFAIETEDFRLIDSKGLSHTLSYHTDRSAILLLSYPHDCASRDAMFEWYSRLNVRLLARNIEVFWINANSDQNRTNVNKEVDGKFLSPVLMDASQVISHHLGFQNGGDYVLLTTNPWAKTASGNWNDGSLEKYLRVRWESPASAPVACRLHYEDRDLKWNEKLAKKFANDCVWCHLKYYKFDFFNSDQDVFQWAAMNLLSLRLGKMPPGGFDLGSGKCGNAYPQGDLDPQDLVEMERWLDAGARHDNNKKDYLADLVIAQRKEIERMSKVPGKPDLFWPIPSVDVPAKGDDFYRYLQVAGPLTEDLNVHMLTFDKFFPGWHHWDLFVIPMSLKEFEKNLPSASSEAEFEQYALQPFYKGLGPLLHINTFRYSDLKFKKGSYIVLSIHYHPYGKAGKIPEQKIGVFKSRESRPERITRSVLVPKFVLKENEKDHHEVITTKMDADVEMEALNLHTHRRGRAARATATLPSGQIEEICNMADFHMFGIGRFYKNIFLPKGTVIRAEFTYDNSSLNITNPNAHESTELGPYLNDEMGVMRIIYHKVAK